MSGRGHPGGDDRARRGRPESAPADVLADFVADVRAGDVAHGAHAPCEGLASRPDVCEVAAEDHALGVTLCGPLEPPVGHKTRLPPAGSLPVDQTQRGGADAREVCLGRLQVRAGTRGGRAACHNAPPSRAMDGPPSKRPSRRGHQRKQGHGERDAEPAAPRSRSGRASATTRVARLVRVITQQRFAKASYPHKHNLFRRPTGLADGLALKEPALLAASPRDSPHLTGVPRSLTLVRDSAFWRGKLASVGDDRPGAPTFSTQIAGIL